MEEKFKSIVNLITISKNATYRMINEEMIKLYLSIGKYLSSIKDKEEVDNIIDSLEKHYNNISFSRKNIEEMIKFYNNYKDDEDLLDLVTNISWTSNMIILDKCKDNDERLFYIDLCINNDCSDKLLNEAIKSKKYDNLMECEDYKLTEEDLDKAFEQIVQLVEEYMGE